MLTKDEVKHIALLARIGLKEEEIEKYQKDLSGVLDFFAQLEEADTEGVEPVRQIVGRENSWREDRDRDFPASAKEAILKIAPETKDGYLKVKSVF
jgi:aspartyl-tRNA(Asn)/glutamyl-tRNA(Gln) amidotransferase subunit C